MRRTRLVVGFHAVGSRLRVRATSIEELYVDAAREDRRMRDLVELARAAGVHVMSVPAERLDAMTGRARHQGVVATAQWSEPLQDLDAILDRADDDTLLLVLDGVQDPHNLGACLRVADAAGVDAVVAPRDRAVGLNATVAKVASGAAETVPYVTVTNLARTLDQIKDANILVVGADGTVETTIYDTPLSGPIAWVLGAEGAGMRRLTRERCDVLASIPLLGSVESLNLSVAAGICLFETRRRVTPPQSADGGRTGSTPHAGTAPRRPEEN